MDIHSKVKPELLTHRIIRLHEAKRAGKDVNHSPDDAMMQVSSKQLTRGDSYRPHRHIPKHVEDAPTGEAWIVIEGEIEMTCYDTDDTVLMKVRLFPGDLAITLAGGHGYEGIADYSIIYEPKSGQYYSRERDKVYIND